MNHDPYRRGICVVNRVANSLQVFFKGLGVRPSGCQQQVENSYFDRLVHHGLFHVFPFFTLRPGEDTPVQYITL